MIFFIILISTFQLNIEGTFYLPDTTKKRIERIENIEIVKDEILSFYLNNGFPYIQINVENIVLIDSIYEIDFNIREGPQVVIENINFIGLNNTSSNYLLRELSLPEKFIYNQKKIMNSIINLNNIEFIKVSENPKIEYYDRIENSTLIIPIQELKSNAFTGSISYIPEEKKIIGDIHFSIKNIFGNGHKLQIHWRQFDKDKTFWSANFKYLWIFSLPLNSDISLSYKKERDLIYLASYFNLSLILRNIELLSGFEYINIIRPLSTIKQLSNISGFIYDSRDNIINPKHGSVFSLKLKSGKVFYNEFNFYSYRIDLLTKHFYNVKNFVLYLKNENSAIFSQDYLDDLKLSYGDNHGLRGYMPESFKAEKAALITVEPRYLFLRNNNIFLFGDLLLLKNNESWSTQHSFGFGISSGRDNIIIKTYLTATKEYTNYKDLVLSAEIEYNF